jgi:predicted lipoprotein
LRLTNLGRRSLLVAGAAALAMPLVACKIVPMAARQKQEQAAAFDGKAWAAKLWAPKVLPYFASHPKPLGDVLKAIAADYDAAGKALGYRASSEGSPWTFVVSGSGTVLKKNTESRAGTLDVALDGGDPNQPVVVQIGPVIIGSAIRNALPFVNFADFTNQLDFADAGKALTTLALAGIDPVLPSIKAGSEISFSGALSMASKSDAIKIVPVTLTVMP